LFLKQQFQHQEFQQLIICLLVVVELVVLLGLPAAVVVLEVLYLVQIIQLQMAQIML
jgi:hypothetical protein